MPDKAKFYLGYLGTEKQQYEITGLMNYCSQQFILKTAKYCTMLC